MPICPRCGSDNKGIRQYPYRNKNMRCRDGWHTVGIRTMPRYIRAALGSSPLTHELDAADYIAGPALPDHVELPIVKALRQANALVELVKPKLQTILDNKPVIMLGNMDRNYVEQTEKIVLDIARLFGITLQTGESQHG